MGGMKNKAIEEQERIALDSLYDAKYWEIRDEEYELYLNSEQYFDDIEAQADEDAFIRKHVIGNKPIDIDSSDVTITQQDICDDISSRMPYSANDVK